VSALATILAWYDVGMERVPNRTPTTASTLIGECERTWDAIRRYHPDLPEVVFSLAEGSRRGLAGHFAAARWEAAGVPDDRRAEVFLAGEVASRGGEGILEVLLHEGAHGLAKARGIRGTDVTGRHNSRYRAIAEEVGLTAEIDPNHAWRGWAETALTDAATSRYHDEIRRPERRKSARNLQRYECGGCGRVMRMAASTWALAPVICGGCGGAFRARGR